jgi:hypothetical protein
MRWRHLPLLLFAGVWLLLFQLCCCSPQHQAQTQRRHYAVKRWKLLEVQQHARRQSLNAMLMVRPSLQEPGHELNEAEQYYPRAIVAN